MDVLKIVGEIKNVLFSEELFDDDSLTLILQNNNEETKIITSSRQLVEYMGKRHILIELIRELHEGKYRTLKKNEMGVINVSDLDVSDKVRKLPKLLILGHARHGKDTLAELLNEMYGLTFISSSQAAADIFIYEDLKDQFGYNNPIECFEDRINHRVLWYDMICAYNSVEKTRLAKEILKKSDCYVGMRDGAEIDQCNKENLFDLIIWVDASERLPKEPANSFNIDESYADVILHNNGTYEEFKNKVKRFGKILING